MEVESLRNGTECMTMLTTMTWLIPTREKTTLAPFLEGHRSILTRVGDEQDARPQRQV